MCLYVVCMCVCVCVHVLLCPQYTGSAFVSACNKYQILCVSACVHVYVFACMSVAIYARLCMCACECILCECIIMPDQTYRFRNQLLATMNLDSGLIFSPLWTTASLLNRAHILRLVIYDVIQHISYL